MNISAKHLVNYMQHIQAQELSASIIKTDLTTIRFWYDQILNPRYNLPENDELNLEHHYCLGCHKKSAITIKGKGGKIREVPLSAVALTMLDEQLKDKTEKTKTVCACGYENPCCNQKIEVFKWLGHERKDITTIYLASVR